MARGWYLRLVVIAVTAVMALFSLWPSASAWVPAPGWLTTFFDSRISPGLDIRGGLRLVYEVEVDEAIRERAENLAEDLRLEAYRLDTGADEGFERPAAEVLQGFARITQTAPQTFRLAFSDAADLAVVDRDLLKDKFPDLRVDSRQENSVTLSLREERIESIEEFAVEQTSRTVGNRIDELQIRETSVIAQERDIIVEVPGADESAFDRIRSIISKTAKLSFKVVADAQAASSAGQLYGDPPEGIALAQESGAAPGGESVQVSYLRAEGEGARERLAAYIETLSPPAGLELAVGRDGASGEEGQSAWRSWLLESRAQVGGEDVDDAFVAYDPQNGNRPYVAINFTAAGGRRFKELTGAHIKERMAIVLDGRVESAPVIQAEIGGGRAQITLGSYMDYQRLADEARDLALVLRAGALPAPIRPANEQLVGPSLGRDSVRAGIKGAVIGVALVFLFMFVYYEVGGLIANAMVALNVLLLLAILAAFEATLTLPGIAGIALTVGMAVDANVLITERIREELHVGKSPRAAVQQGFSRAFWSVFDAQITTLIAGVVLFQYGTGPIKGFAVTLMIGIVTSLFTGLFCSRTLLETLVSGLRVKRLRVG